MANRFAVASGNFNDTATWSTTAAGSPGASVPVSGDNAIANNRTVTITANATCDNITNGTTYGGTAGGGFVLNNGVTLTANVIQGIVPGTCVQFSGVSPNSAAIVGTITGGGVTTTIAVTNSSTGSLNITGSSIGRAFSNASTGTLNIVGNCSATGSAGSVPLLTNSTGVINITGNCVGGAGGASHCVSSTGSGAVNITGGVTGGSVSNASGLNNTSTGQVTIIGDVTATSAHAVVAASATVRISGSFYFAIDGLVPVSAPRIILNTTPLAAKTRYALNGVGNFVDMFTADNTGLAPAVGDVRAGVVYGSATGALAVPPANSVAFGVPVDNTTGTAILTGAAVATAVWSAASRTITGGTVDTLTNAPSVPSASAIASQVRSELSVELGRLDASVSSRLAPSGTLATVTNLTNAPASVTPSDIWSHAARTLTSASGPTAVEIRQEIDANSTKLDAAISSRMAASESTKIDAVKAKTDNLPASPAATGDIPSANIAAIKSKTDLLNTDRLANVATTNIVGTLLAQANS